MSITVPMPSENIAALPPEVVKALKVKPSSTLIYEIKEDGRVLLSAKSGRIQKSKPEAGRGKTPAFAELAGTFSESAPKTDAGRMDQLLKIAGTFPGLKPGVKPATIEELNDVIAQRAVARYERSLK